VKNQDSLMGVAPSAQFLNVFLGSQTGSPTLIGLQNNPSHIFRLQTTLVETLFKKSKSHIFGPEPIWKRDLHHGRIQIDNPFLQRRDATDHLRPQGAAVESPLEGDNAVFVAASPFDSKSPSQFYSAFDRLGSSG